MFISKSEGNQEPQVACNCSRKWPTLTLSEMLDSKTITLLALWHTFGVWLATFILIASASDQLLTWNIQFYLSIYGNVTEAWKTTLFFVTFMKSWILIHTYSQIVRFSFWMFRGAWRADTFEAYRRALCGEAKTDLEEGVLYRHSWVLNHSRCSQRVHFVLQLVIYVTLDFCPLVPLCMAVSSGETILNSIIASFRTLALVSLIHILLFFVSWNITDVVLKATSFLEAYRSTSAGSNVSLEEGRPPPEAGEPAQLEDEDSAPDEAERSSKASETEGRQSHGTLPRHANEGPRLEEAEKLNLCYQICTCWRGTAKLRYFVEWLVVMIALFVTPKMTLFEATACIGLIGIMFYFTDRCLLNRSRKKARVVHSNRLEALQHWAETNCSMSLEAQYHVRLTFIIMVIQLTLVCALANFVGLMWACIGLLGFNVARQLLVHIERPYSWFWGIFEGSILAIVTAGLCHLQSVDAWTDCGIVLILSFARQFGLNKKVKDGVRIERAVTIFLNAVTIVVVVVIMFTVISGGEVKEFSLFCTENDPTCSYYRIPYKSEIQSSPQCSLKFPLADHGSTSDLTLADFGLFSGLAYEYPAGAKTGLTLNFPNWRTDFVHLPDLPKLGAASNYSSDLRDLDWTAFYQFTSNDNATSVFAIRGTFEPIDALLDIALWLQASVLMFFSALGPDIPYSLTRLSASLQGIFLSLKRDHNGMFDILINKVEEQLKANPQRRFYMTGHSLGGGLAKLVAAEITRRNPTAHLPAIAYAGPGLAVTSLAVFRHDLTSQLIDGSLTVQPEHDIVSRIDVQKGSVVPVTCDGTLVSFHWVYKSLCSIYASCGSMRPDRDVIMPCGQCDDMPCPK